MNMTPAIRAQIIDQITDTMAKIQAKYEKTDPDLIKIQETIQIITKIINVAENQELETLMKCPTDDQLIRWWQVMFVWCCVTNNDQPTLQKVANTDWLKNSLPAQVIKLCHRADWDVWVCRDCWHRVQVVDYEKSKKLWILQFGDNSLRCARTEEIYLSTTKMGQNVPA